MLFWESTIKKIDNYNYMFKIKIDFKKSACFELLYWIMIIDHMFCYYKNHIVKFENNWPIRICSSKRWGLLHFFNSCIFEFLICVYSKCIKIMLITSLHVCRCPTLPNLALNYLTLPLLPYLQLYLGLSHTLWYTYTVA